MPYGAPAQGACSRWSIGYGATMRIFTRGWRRRLQARPSARTTSGIDQCSYAAAPGYYIERVGASELDRRTVADQAQVRAPRSSAATEDAVVLNDGTEPACRPGRPRHRLRLDEPVGAELISPGGRRQGR